MAAKSPNHTPPPHPRFSSFGMLFCTPLHLLPHPPPISYPSSLPLSSVSHFSHLTYALAQNKRISFTSNSSQTYKESQMIQCHKRVPRTSLITRGRISGNRNVELGEKERDYTTNSYCRVRLAHLKTIKKLDQESCIANIQMSKEVLHTLVGDVWTTEQ